jgi:betaine-aldehyde dehydrogenase
MNTPTRKAEHIQTLIAGQWRDASGAMYSTEYPFDGSVVTTLHAATVNDVNEAIEAAEAARLQPHQRAAFLHKIASSIRARAEELAKLQMLDNGKPITECRGLVASAAGTFQYFAAVCETFEDPVTPQRGEYMSISMHEPLGVVGAITPWNSPIASEASSNPQKSHRAWRLSWRGSSTRQVRAWVLAVQTFLKRWSAYCLARAAWSEMR